MAVFSGKPSPTGDFCRQPRTLAAVVKQDLLSEILFGDIMARWYWTSSCEFFKSYPQPPTPSTKVKFPSLAVGVLRS